MVFMVKINDIFWNQHPFITASDQRGMAGMRILSGEKINPDVKVSVVLGSAAQVMLAGKAKTTCPEIC